MGKHAPFVSFHHSIVSHFIFFFLAWFPKASRELTFFVDVYMLIYNDVRFIDQYYLNLSGDRHLKDN